MSERLQVIVQDGMQRDLDRLSILARYYAHDQTRGGKLSEEQNELIAQCARLLLVSNRLYLAAGATGDFQSVFKLSEEWAGVTHAQLDDRKKKAGLAPSSIPSRADSLANMVSGHIRIPWEFAKKELEEKGI